VNPDSATNCASACTLPQCHAHAHVNTMRLSTYKRRTWRFSTYDKQHEWRQLLAQSDQVEDEVDADCEQGRHRDKLDPAVTLVARVHDRANESDEADDLKATRQYNVVESPMWASHKTDARGQLISYFK